MPKKFDNNPRQKPVIVPTSFPLDNDIYKTYITKKSGRIRFNERKSTSRN